MVLEMNPSSSSDEKDGIGTARTENFKLSRKGKSKRRESLSSDLETTNPRNGSANHINLQNCVEAEVMQPECRRVANRERKRALTYQDICHNQDIDDDDEENDKNWVPTRVNWFCINCSMPNTYKYAYCNTCGEHKKLFKHGINASSFIQDTGSVSRLNEIEKSKDVISKASCSKSSTAVGYDERMLLHEEVEMKSRPHPERPDRLRAIAGSLSAAGIFPGKCHPISAREITKEELLKVHSFEQVQEVDCSSQECSSYFSSDTYANKHSAMAARIAAGLCADLASAILSGRFKNGFALVRPPGHHAGVRHPSGFCLHNNAAVAALTALSSGAKRVLILDWDVHHGNGTQEIFETNKSVLYISLHRHEGGGFYPGTGAATEVGSGGAEGYCVNIPWNRGGVGDNDYLFAFRHVVIPIASEFAPDFTIISAGFDAARGDPLGFCDVTPSGYAKMTSLLRGLSDGKLLVILEGGYNLRSISASAIEVIRVLLDEFPNSEMHDASPSRSGMKTVLDVLGIQKSFWPSLSSRIPVLQQEAESMKKKESRKRQAINAPIWWKWGRKRLLFYVLGRHLSSK